MILCHKCSGVLAASPEERLNGLHSCGCMSGWVRGFEPNLNRTEAIQQQLKQAHEWVAHFKWQGRRQEDIDFHLARISRLEQLS